MKSLDNCTNQREKIEPCPLSEERRVLSTEVTSLEKAVFYDYMETGIRTPASMKLRKQYDALRTSMPYQRQEYIERLHELEALKERILVLEG